VRVAVLLLCCLLGGCIAPGLQGSADTPHSSATSAPGSSRPAAAGACTALASGPATALIQVRDPQGKLAAGVVVQAARNWTAYDQAKSDERGCLAFAFKGAGEYEFATTGGCAVQGATSSDWDGAAKLELTLSTQDVCQS